MKSFKDNSKSSGNVIKILIKKHLFVTTAPYKPDSIEASFTRLKHYLGVSASIQRRR